MAKSDDLFSGLKKPQKAKAGFGSSETTKKKVKAEKTKPSEKVINIKLNSLLEFVKGFSNECHVEKVIGISAEVYDFVEWLMKSNQQFALNQIFEKINPKIRESFKEVVKNATEEDMKKLSDDGLDLANSQLERIADSLNILEVLQSLLSESLEVEGRVFLYAWQFKEKFIINKNDDAETVAAKENLIGFTNNRLALYSVVGTMVALILTYLIKSSNKPLSKTIDVNEPGFPVLLRYLLESQANTHSIQTNILALVSYHRLYLEIFGNIENNQYTKKYWDRFAPLFERLDQGGAEFNSYKFPIERFNTRGDATMDKAFEKALTLVRQISSTENPIIDTDINVAKHISSIRNIPSKVAEATTNRYHLKTQSEEHHVLLNLVQILFNPRFGEALENIDTKIAGAYDKILFPLIPTLAKKRSELAKTNSRNLSKAQEHEQNDLAFLGGNLHNDLGHILQDYSTPKKIAILHEVRYNVSSGQTLDLLSRLGEKNLIYKTLNLSSESIREFWFKSTNAQISNDADLIWKDESGVSLIDIESSKKEIKNYLTSVDSSESSLIIQWFKKSNFKKNDTLPEFIIDFIEYLESQLGLILFTKYDGINYSNYTLFNLRQIIDFKEIGNSLESPSEQEQGDEYAELGLTDAWSKLLQNNPDILFPANNENLEGAAKRKKAFENTLIKSNLTSLNNSITAHKLIKVLSETAINISQKGVENAILNLRKFYRSEIRPIRGIQSIVIDISSAERLIIDFDLLEKGIIVPIYAGEPHKERWY